MRNDTALLLALREQVDALERRHDGLQGANVNTWWLLSNGILVFFMVFFNGKGECVCTG